MLSTFFTLQKPFVHFFKNVFNILMYAHGILCLVTKIECQLMSTTRNRLNETYLHLFVGIEIFPVYAFTVRVVFVTKTNTYDVVCFVTKLVSWPELLPLHYPFFIQRILEFIIVEVLKKDNKPVHCTRIMCSTNCIRVEFVRSPSFFTLILQYILTTYSK